MLGAGRWRFGAIRAKERGRCRTVDSATKIESAYHDRRRRQQADDAGERDKACIRASARVPHLACAIALTRVMRRARLPRYETGAADVVVFGRDAMAAERDRRGGNAGDLARQPEQHDP